MKRERRVWIAQYLCGPNRHCIVAMAGEADTEREAERLVPQVHDAAARLLADGAGNPWCAICGAKRQDSWVVEIGRTRFRTMAEAEAPLQQSHREQMLANALFGTHGPKPPGKPN